MTNDETKARAERRLEAAVRSTVVEDPRGPYRQRLVWLRKREATAFEEATRHYEETVVDRLADPETDALAEWVDYGRYLAGLTGEGRLVAIDGTGLARPYRSPPTGEHLVLHVPDDESAPVLLLVMPSEATAAQRATRDLLVLGRTELTG